MPREARHVSLLTAAERIEIFVRRERLAAYRYGESVLSGFTALYAADDRPVTQPGAAGPALWLAHGNINGVAFKCRQREHEPGKREPGRHKPEDIGQGTVSEETDRWAASSCGTSRRGAAGSRSGFSRRATGATRWTNCCSPRCGPCAPCPAPDLGRILDIEVRLRAPGPVVRHFGRSAHSLLQIRAASRLFAVGTGQVRNSRGDYGQQPFMAATPPGAPASAWCRAARSGSPCWSTRKTRSFRRPGSAARRRAVTHSRSPGGRSGFRRATPLHLRYRLHIYSGYVDQGWADARLADFARER